MPEPAPPISELQRSAHLSAAGSTMTKPVLWWFHLSTANGTPAHAVEGF